FQKDSAERSHEATQRPQALMGQPVSVELVLEIQLFSQPLQQPIIPLFYRQVLADSGAIEGGDPYSLCSQVSGGACHERGLTHLPGREDVTELSLQESVMEFGVGLSPDIGRGIGAETASRHIEACFGIVHAWFLFLPG